MRQHEPHASENFPKKILSFLAAFHNAECAAILQKSIEHMWKWSLAVKGLHLQIYLCRLIWQRVSSLPLLSGTLGNVKGVWVSGLSRETGDCGQYNSVYTVTVLTEREKGQGLVTLTFTLCWMKLLVTLLLRKHNAKGLIAPRHALWAKC